MMFIIVYLSAKLGRVYGKPKEAKLFYALLGGTGVAVT
ncbi:hypothetical protein FHS83_002532 [Rhizomicrobium palustre]|uniref:Uncharacterized protein n=1 Tax=Rhizomicrobium palustre TaxID=189966 RepID=A0A846MZX2_9PROT|nr:hypothetical protein [Rhizomicrobium palustre]